MKKKTLTACLLASVLLLWGLIFYRVFWRGQPAVSAPSADSVPGTDDSENLLWDTLLLAYRDPFLGGQLPAVPNREPSEGEPLEEELRAAPTPDNAGRATPAGQVDFRYSGVIYNLKDKRVVTLMTIQGRAVLLREGEVHQGLTLLKNSGQSITIHYEGKIYKLVKE